MATVYNGNGCLVITLKGSDGKPVGGVRVNVALGGRNYQLTADKNCQVKVSTNGLAPVRTCAARSFNANAAKKYTVALKTNRNKSLKSAVITQSRQSHNKRKDKCQRRCCLQPCQADQKG